MRLFLDANILFTAAHNAEGKASLVMELGQAGLWQLVSSAYALEEARRNIARKYPDRLQRLQTLTQDLALAPTDLEVRCPQPLPEKDCPIYRAALTCKADILLTGDIRDFGFLMHQFSARRIRKAAEPPTTPLNDRTKADGLLIQTVADFLAKL